MTMLLDDHGAMYLSATRAGLRPCIGLVVRFDEPVSPQAVRAWAATLAGNPLGFGRRVVGSRVPGARSRWMPAREVPPIRYEPGPLGRHELNELLEEEVSSLPDPVGGFGWQVAAAGVEGGGAIQTPRTDHAHGHGPALRSPASHHAPPAPDRFARG